MADEEDRARIGAGGEFGGKLLALGFVVGEADLDQAVVRQRLVQRGNDGVVHACPADVKNGIKPLGAGFEFAHGRFFHAMKRKRE